MENKELLKSLNDTKDKSASIAASLKESTKLQDELEKEGNVYLPVANFASKMYFNLADLSKLNNMYRISLDSFNRLFEKTLQRAPYKGDTQCSKIGKKCNFKSTKTRFLQFQKWQKINFCTKKKFKIAFLVVLNFFLVQKLIFCHF